MFTNEANLAAELAYRRERISAAGLPRRNRHHRRTHRARAARAISRITSTDHAA